MRRDATPCWNTPHSVGPVSSICHRLTRALCIASYSYSQQLSQASAQISTHRNSSSQRRIVCRLTSPAHRRLAGPSPIPTQARCSLFETKTDTHSHAPNGSGNTHTIASGSVLPHPTTPCRLALRVFAPTHACMQPHNPNTYICDRRASEKKISGTGADRRSLEWPIVYIGYVNWRAVSRSLNAACLYAGQTFGAVRQD
jgi:hypothetical protein